MRWTQPHPHTKFDARLWRSDSRLLYFKLRQHARDPGRCEEEVDGHVLFRTNWQLAVSSQTLFRAEHTLKLKEKYIESTFSIFSFTIRARCKQHQTNTQDAKFYNGRGMHFKHHIIHLLHLSGFNLMYLCDTGWFLYGKTCLKTVLVLTTNKQPQLLCGAGRVVPEDQFLLTREQKRQLHACWCVNSPCT